MVDLCLQEMTHTLIPGTGNLVTKTYALNAMET